MEGTEVSGWVINSDYTLKETSFVLESLPDPSLKVSERDEEAWRTAEPRIYTAFSYDDCASSGCVYNGGGTSISASSQEKLSQALGERQSEHFMLSKAKNLAAEKYRKIREEYNLAMSNLNAACQSLSAHESQ